MAWTKEKLFTELAKVKFSNLHHHTHFSTLDGVGTIKDHMCGCHQKNLYGFFPTDHGVMHGNAEAHRLAHDKEFLKANGLPLDFPTSSSCEVYITTNLEEKDKANKYNHMTIFAYNQKGYENLCTLVSIAHKPDAFFTRPRISEEQLFAHKEGLIVTSGCFIGMIPQAIFKGTGQEEELMEKYIREFGDNFYVEIHPCNINKKWDRDNKRHIVQTFKAEEPKDESVVKWAKHWGIWTAAPGESQAINLQEIVNRRLIEIADKCGVKMYFTQDAHMPTAAHHDAQTYMIWNSPSGKDGWHFPEAYPIMSVAETAMAAMQNCPYIPLERYPELFNNSQLVVEKLKHFRPAHELVLPPVDNEANPVNHNEALELALLGFEKQFETEDEEFVKLLNISKGDLPLRTGLKTILDKGKIDLNNEKYRHRITSELFVIQRNGIVPLMDYFNFLGDVNLHIVKAGELAGPGRGSSAGSLVAYAMDITDADPISYGLLFERFLTEERCGKMDFSMPDIK